ncbi:MAG: hypothetical protein EOP88_04795 [Verrucomicrobiaceae bacterium]|nr:MAG: hypothetical protein EOP88_04795 [Verrucomicrobiaceae bacterium]
MRTTFLSILTLLLGMTAGSLLDSKLGSLPRGETVLHDDGPIGQLPIQQKTPGSLALLGDFLDGRDPSNLDAAEAYQLLLPWLSRDMTEKSYETTLEGMRENIQFKLLMDALPLPALEKLLEQARQGGLAFENSRDVFAAYARRDWDMAMKWAQGQPDKLELLSSAISLLAETDPDRAEILYQQAINNGKVADREEIIAKLSRHKARKGSAALFAFMDSLPFGDFGTPYRIGFNSLPDVEIPAFMEEYERRASAVPRYYPMNDLVLDLADSHPEQFERWANRLDLEPRIHVKLRVAVNLSYRGRNVDASRLLEECISDSPGGREELLKENWDTLQMSPALTAEIRKKIPEGWNRQPE